MLRVRFSEKLKQDITNNVTIYYQINDRQLINIFMPDKYTYTIVDENDPADICILGKNHTDNTLLRNNEVNILLSIENMLPIERETWYQHVIKYGRYGNDMVDLYIYNDEFKFKDTDLKKKIVPVVYLRLKYYNKIEENYMNNTMILSPSINFDNRLFVLFVSRNRTNLNKDKVLNKLNDLGQVDLIDKYDDILKTVSCYNEIELLKIFNKYKFIVCFENSKADGYVTEKIFNVFLSKSIPIYDGPSDIDTYINPKSYLKYDDNLFDNVKKLMNDKTQYNDMINQTKIQPISDDINIKLNNFLDNSLISKSIILENFSTNDLYKKKKYCNNSYLLLLFIIIIIIIIIIL
jgi:hypothetical protein